MTRTTLALFATLALLIGGCAEDEPPVAQEPQVDGAAREPSAAPQPSTPAGAADGTEVLVQGFRFSPPALTVAAGDTVTWTNEDAVPHTVTADSPGGTDGGFDLELSGQSATVSRQFTEAGTYPYFCRIHPSMTAEIVVNA